MLKGFQGMVFRLHVWSKTAPPRIEPIENLDQIEPAFREALSRTGAKTVCLLVMGDEPIDVQSPNPLAITFSGKKSFLVSTRVQEAYPDRFAGEPLPPKFGGLFSATAVREPNAPKPAAVSKPARLGRPEGMPKVPKSLQIAPRIAREKREGKPRQKREVAPVRSRTFTAEEFAEKRVAFERERLVDRMLASSVALDEDRKSSFLYRFGLPGDVARASALDEKRNRQLASQAIALIERNEEWPHLLQRVLAEKVPFEPSAVVRREPWAKGLSSKALVNLARHLLPARPYVISAGSVEVVSTIPPLEWAEIVRKAEFAVAGASARISEEDMLARVSEALPKGVSDGHVRVLKAELGWPEPGHPEWRVIVKAGGRLAMTSLVDAILQESDEPAHLMDIHSRISTILGEGVSFGNLRNVLGRHEHCGNDRFRASSVYAVSDLELDRIARACERIVERRKEQDFVALNDFPELLKREEGIDDRFAGDLVTVRAAIRRSSLENVGWGRFGNKAQSFRKEVLETLLSAPRAVSEDEFPAFARMPNPSAIRLDIMQRSANLAYMGSRTWGLFGREVPIDEFEMDEVLRMARDRVGDREMRLKDLFREARDAGEVAGLSNHMQFGAVLRRSFRLTVTAGGMVRAKNRAPTSVGGLVLAELDATGASAAKDVDIYRNVVEKRGGDVSFTFFQQALRTLGRPVYGRNIQWVARDVPVGEAFIENASDRSSNPVRSAKRFIVSRKRPVPEEDVLRGVAEATGKTFDSATASRWLKGFVGFEGGRLGVGSYLRSSPEGLAIVTAAVERFLARNSRGAHATDADVDLALRKQWRFASLVSAREIVTDAIGEARSKYPVHSGDELAGLQWTEERLETLKQLWLSGVPSGEIAERLQGVTRNAVMGRLHRLGLLGEEREAEPAPAPGM